MLVGFDIETAKLAPENRSDSYKLGITCAALTFEDGTRIPFYPGFGIVNKTLSNSPHAIEWQSSPGYVGGNMSIKDLGNLVVLLEKVYYEGHELVTWNGSGFDFRVLWEELEGIPIFQESIVNITLDHLDIMLQVLCTKGFPVGLEACSKAMLGKFKVGMHGEEAVVEWAKGAEERSRVIDYVQGDADLTMETAAKIQETGVLKWITKAGKISELNIRKLLTVRQSLELPLPDTSWMSAPMERGDVVQWIISSSPTPPLSQNILDNLYSV